MNRRKLKKSKIYTAFLNIKSFAKADPQIAIRLVLLLLIVLSISAVSIGYWINDSFNFNPINKKEYITQSSDGIDASQQSFLPEPNPIDIELAENIKVEQEKIKAEQERLAALRQVKIDKVAAYLKKVGSPMAPYTHIIIEEAERCGANYELIVAIAGNESGYGKVSYKQYNPFGYLNGVQYSGWDQSLKALTCKVAAYTNKYGYNLTALGKAYGAQNVETWAKNVSWHISQIP